MDDVVTQSVPTEANPTYTKFRQASAATQFWGIRVNEGWREWILCGDMYEWAADQLLARLNAGSGGWKHPE